MISDTQRAIHAVFRIESARLIAGLARIVRDVGLAEELAQDALVAALEHWPVSGVPDNPGAWLMATAKRRAIDELRRNKRWQKKQDAVGHEIEARAKFAAPDLDAALDDDVGDDLLRLVFTSCHPLLSTESRVALTLRLLGGLTTEEIARAFLTPEATIAQRIVRAKKQLTESGVPFEVPRGAELAARLSSVLEVVYLIFNEGYSATAGEDWMRPALCEDALRLGRILAELSPSEPEVHGLVALMEIQASRSLARVGPGGEPILLLEQNRGRWDQLLIRRGLAALSRAEELGGAGGGSAGAAGGASGAVSMGGTAGASDGSFKVFMIASTAPEHTPMSNAAIPVLQNIGAANHFSVDSTSDPSLMTDENLAKYQVFLQMQLGSFEMPPTAQAALQKFIESGKGWVGVHAAGLTGIQFIEDQNGKIIGDLQYWPWYTIFVGGDENFIWSIHPQEQIGTLKIENRTFPATKNLPASFQLNDEWYEWKENPRPNVTVLGTADETTYTPVNRQGDHPIVWSNPKYPHTIYIGVGHDKSSLSNTNYVNLLRDSVLYAAGKL